MVQNEAGEPKTDHEIFHNIAMNAAISVIRQFEIVRDKLAKDDTPDSRSQYNGVCISLGKMMALCSGLTVGMSDNARYEARLLMAFIIVFLGDLVEGDILPVQAEIELAKKLTSTLGHDGVVH